MLRLLALELRSKTRQLLLECISRDDAAVLGNALFQGGEVLNCRSDRRSYDCKPLIEGTMKIA